MDPLRSDAMTTKKDGPGMGTVLPDFCIQFFVFPSIDVKSDVKIRAALVFSGFVVLYVKAAIIFITIRLISSNGAFLFRIQRL